MNPSDAQSQSQRQGSSRPTMPPEATEAMTAPRAIDAPRRCFICLTDEEASDPPSSWVNPCPCTLEAHQDCIMSWVTDCERSNKPLLCPVCKARITLEGPWDPLVALSDVISAKFTRASPFVLFTGVSMGVQFSLQMYGAMAMWTFSGKDALLHFMLGPDMVIDGRGGRVPRLGRERLGNALVLMNVAPALLLGQVAPWLGNKIFLPTASLYGFYHVMHDEKFLAWPPSPQLAMAIFPYIRSAYYNFWREFLYPYEVNLNRRILGLPPLEPQQNEQQGANNRRGGQRNGEGGVMGFLQGILDALDPDDEEQGGDDPAQQIRIAHEQVEDGEDGEGGNGGGVVLEVVIEEIQDDDDWGADEAAPEPAAQPQNEEAAQDEGAAPEAPAGNDAAAAPPQNHEVPQAPPARRPGLGSILSGMSNAIVSALILPGISFAMGEFLRLALPRPWTQLQSRSSWYRPGGVLGRPGLLQQQWGRSLVGGCLFVVMKDAIRLYSKYRKVASMGQRRVKNVDRRRGHK